MSDAKIEYVVDGLSASLKELEDRGGNVADLLPVVGEILRSAIDEVFLTEGRGEWEVSRRVLEEGGTILQDTGRLAASIAIEEIGGDTVEAFALEPYGKFHVFGTKYMPARDYLDIDFIAVSDEVSEFILGEILS